MAIKISCIQLILPFFGRLSAFSWLPIYEKGDRDYESNQRTRTLMKKERIHISSNTTDILLDRLSAQTKPKDKATETSDNTEAKSDDSQ